MPKTGNGKSDKVAIAAEIEALRNEIPAAEMPAAIVAPLAQDGKISLTCDTGLDPRLSLTRSYRGLSVDRIEQALRWPEPSVGGLHGIHGDLPAAALLKRTGDLFLGTENTDMAVRRPPFFRSLLCIYEHELSSGSLNGIKHLFGAIAMLSE